MELIKELFVEILISGILFVFGISPILIRCSPSVWPKKGLLPKLGEWDEWKPWVIIAIALVYATGVAGNRFVEVLYHEWIGFQATITVKQDNQEKVFKSHEVEFAARNHGVISRDWVERHKTYRKVLRAASFSSLLFVLSMFCYRIPLSMRLRWLKPGERPHRIPLSIRLKRLKPEERPPGRYVALHYVTASVLFVFFSFAFYYEDRHFKCDLFRHQTVFQPPAQVASMMTAPACAVRE